MAVDFKIPHKYLLGRWTATWGMELRGSNNAMDWKMCVVMGLGGSMFEDVLKHPKLSPKGLK